MRRLARVVLLCLGCGLCSLLYAFSQLAVSLEQEAPRCQRNSAFAVRRQLSGGNTRLGAVAGSAGRDDRHRRSEPERFSHGPLVVSFLRCTDLHMAHCGIGRRGLIVNQGLSVYDSYSTIFAMDGRKILNPF